MSSFILATSLSLNGIHVVIHVVKTLNPWIPISQNLFPLFVYHPFAVVLGLQSKVTVEEGENVTLPCSTSFQGGTLYKTTWFKGKQKLMVITASRNPDLPPSIYKYSQRKNPYSLVGQQSIRLTGVDRYDHGNYSCTAIYVLQNFDLKNVRDDVMLLVKGKTIYHIVSFARSWYYLPA